MVTKNKCAISMPGEAAHTPCAWPIGMLCLQLLDLQSSSTHDSLWETQQRVGSNADSSALLEHVEMMQHRH